MGLFDKKYCDICGNKIGLFGNRKLEDGNLCGDCAKKLSPWFSERRSSTVEEIRGQLAYREENKQAVAQFNTTASYGRVKKLLLDEDQQLFMVASTRNIQEENPDVLSFSQVTGCELDIDENKTELKTKDAQGNSVSYNPPRYKYTYEFYTVIHVNHPYFDEIRFKLNDDTVSVETPDSGYNTGYAANRPGVQQPVRPGVNTAVNRPGTTGQVRPGVSTTANRPASGGVLGNINRPGLNNTAARPATPVRPGTSGQVNRPGAPSGARPGVAPNTPVGGNRPTGVVRPGVQQPVRPGATGQVRPGVNNAAVRPGAAGQVRPGVNAGFNNGQRVGMNNAFAGGRGYVYTDADMRQIAQEDMNYQTYWAMGEDIKAILLNIRQNVRDEIEEANAPKAAVNCPYCGATTIPDASGCCEYCGASLVGLF